MIIVTATTGLTEALNEHQDKQAQRIYAQASLVDAHTRANEQAAINWRLNLMTTVTLIKATGWADTVLGIILGAAIMTISPVVFKKTAGS
jgi:hypothetical protein